MRQRCQPVHVEVVHRLAQVGGDGGRAGDGVEQDVPLRAERHEHDAADVEARAGGDEHGDDEREHEVGREAGEDLHERLGGAGDAGAHADLHADGHPDQRGDDHDRRRRAGTCSSRGTNDVGHGAEPDGVARCSARPGTRPTTATPPTTTANTTSPTRRRRASACKRVLGEPEGSGDAVEEPTDRMQAASDSTRAGSSGAARRSTMLRGRSADSVVSLRNFSDHATSGRQKKKLTPRTITTITTIASRTSPRSPSADGGRDVAADPRQRVLLVQDADRLGRDEEEPAAAEAHHPVPHQADHRLRARRASRTAATS